MKRTGNRCAVFRIRPVPGCSPWAVFGGIALPCRFLLILEEFRLFACLNCRCPFLGHLGKCRVKTDIVEGVGFVSAGKRTAVASALL